MLSPEAPNMRPERAKTIMRSVYRTKKPVDIFDNEAHQRRRHQ